MKNNILFLLLFASFLPQSCKKQIEINFPKVEPTLVVNSLFSPDSVFKAHISTISGMQNTENTIIENAECLLFAENNIIDTLKHIGDGFYISLKELKPNFNTNYKIVVKAHNFPQTIAEDRLQSELNVENVELIDSVRYDEYGFILHQINLKFNDLPDIKNFYEIELQYKYNNEFIYGLTIFSQDKALINTGLLDYYPEQIPFSDEMFYGEKYTVKVDFLIPIQEWQDGVEVSFLDKVKPIITFRSISENYYRYKRQLIIHTNNQYSDVWNGMAEPIPMFSNIDGGYGIFAGYTSQVDTLVFDY